MAIQSERELICAERKPHPGRRMTWQEFHKWSNEYTHADWIDGEVIRFPPATDPHQALVSFFDTLLTLFVARMDAGSIRTAPFQIKLSNSSHEPDLIFVAKQHQHRIQRTFLDGPPDIAIEIVSRSTRRHDRIVKFGRYEANGVREYWMIDPEKRTVEFYRLGDDGKFHLVAWEQGEFCSEVLTGFRLKEAWLWNDPLSHIHEIAREVGAI